MSAFYYVPAAFDTFFPTRQAPRRPQRPVVYVEEDDFFPFSPFAHVSRRPQVVRPRPVVYVNHNNVDDGACHSCHCHRTGASRYEEPHYGRRVPQPQRAPRQRREVYGGPFAAFHPSMGYGYGFGYDDEDEDVDMVQDPCVHNMPQRARYPAPEKHQPEAQPQAQPQAQRAAQKKNDESADVLLAKLLRAMLGQREEESSAPRPVKREADVQKQEVEERKRSRCQAAGPRKAVKPKMIKRERRSRPVTPPPSESEEELPCYQRCVQFPTHQSASKPTPIRVEKPTGQPTSQPRRIVVESASDADTEKETETKAKVVAQKLQRIQDLEKAYTALAHPEILASTLHQPLTFTPTFQHVTLASRSYLELREGLNLLVKQLDEIESDGEESVRTARKTLIGKIMKTLDTLEAYENNERERQSEASSAGSASETEVPSDAECDTLTKKQEQTTTEASETHWSDVYEGVAELFAA